MMLVIKSVGGVGYLISDSGMWYKAGTPYKVIDVLEEANKTKERIRLFYGNSETGKLWLEEHDVIGTVGRSVGAMPVPILLYSARFCGGANLLSRNVLRIDARRRGKIVRLYEADNIKLPLLFVKQIDEGWNVIDCNTDVRVACFFDTEKVDPRAHDVTIVRYSGEKKARNYIAFMRGERWTL